MASDDEETQDSPSNQMALEDALNSALGASPAQELSNTAKAYGPRQAQWKDFCKARSFDDDDLVTEPKVCQWLQEDILQRRTTPRRRGRGKKRKRGEQEAVDLEDGVRPFFTRSTINVYIAALVELYRAQVSVGKNTHADFRGEELRALLRSRPKDPASSRREVSEELEDQFIEQGNVVPNRATPRSQGSLPNGVREAVVNEPLQLAPEILSAIQNSHNAIMQQQNMHFNAIQKELSDIKHTLDAFVRQGIRVELPPLVGRLAASTSFSQPAAAQHDSIPQAPAIIQQAPASQAFTTQAPPPQAPAPQAFTPQALAPQAPTANKSSHLPPPPQPRAYLSPAFLRDPPPSAPAPAPAPAPASAPTPPPVPTPAAAATGAAATAPTPASSSASASTSEPPPPRFTPVPSHPAPLSHDAAFLPAIYTLQPAKNVSEAWREWNVGVHGMPPLRLVEETRGNTWRPTKREKTAFCRRKAILDAVQERINGGMTADAAIAELEVMREGGTLNSLYENLKKAKKARMALAVSANSE